MKKILFILIFTCINCLGMIKTELPDNAPATIQANTDSATIKKRAKRKLSHTSESDGYDKEIRQSKKSVAEISAALAQKYKSNMFQCSICPIYQKLSKKNVDNHIQSYHPDKPEARIKEISPEGKVIREIEVKNLGKTFKCTECEKSFAVSYYLTAHLKNKHGKKRKKQLPQEQELISGTLNEPVPLATQTEKSDSFTIEELDRLFNTDEFLKK